MSATTTTYTKKELQAAYDSMFVSFSEGGDEGYEEAINVLMEQEFAPNATHAQKAHDWLRRFCTPIQIASIKSNLGVLAKDL